MPQPVRRSKHTMTLINIQEHLGRPATAVLVTLPVAVPVIYAIYINAWISSNTTSITGRRDKRRPTQGTSTASIRDPVSLPEEVRVDDGYLWTVNYERVVSNPISIDSMGIPVEQGYTLQASPLLREYLRATHSAFSWTPQAFLIRAMIKEPEVKRTFGTTWIRSLNFALGDYVNGVYKVSHHQKDGSSERVELIIEAPASYKGPAVRGLLAAAIEPANEKSKGGGDQVVLVNETWMWRRVSEPLTLLETPFGKWFHEKLAGWLIMKGVNHVVSFK